tara:strand:+ start:596 stop:724 length:129 start_codon:yes stop_codon:yes gene_type:complete
MMKRMRLTGKPRNAMKMNGVLEASAPRRQGGAERNPGEDAAG